MLGWLTSGLVRWAIGGFGVLAVAGGLILYGDHRGAVRVRAEWTAAEQAAQRLGENARAGAEKSVGPAGRTPTQPCLIRDVYDRECSR